MNPDAVTETGREEVVRPIGRTFFMNEPLRIYGTPEEPLFLVADLRPILGFQAKPETLLRGHPEDEKLMRIIHASGQRREAWFVTEPGLYRLIFKSRRPEAEALKRKVFHDVLPSLRKHGQFPPPKSGDLQVIVPESLMAWCPQGDAAFDALPVSRRILIGERLRACAEFEAAPHLSIKRRCEDISWSYAGRNRGWSWISVYRFGRAWLQGGRHWQCVNPRYERCGARRRQTRSLQDKEAA